MLEMFRISCGLGSKYVEQKLSSIWEEIYPEFTSLGSGKVVPVLRSDGCCL